MPSDNNKTSNDDSIVASNCKRNIYISQRKRKEGLVSFAQQVF